MGLAIVLQSQFFRWMSLTGAPFESGRCTAESVHMWIRSSKLANPCRSRRTSPLLAV